MTPQTASPLHDLAGLAGVLTGYDDAFDHPQKTSDETLRGILTLFGFDVSTEERTRRTLEAHQSALAERGLEPVYVVYSGEALEVLIVTRRLADDEALIWQLKAEDGTVQEGASRFGETALVETFDIANVAYERRRLVLASAWPDGYYDLTIEHAGKKHLSRIIIAPRTCYLPPLLRRRGVWGLAAHVYALRSQHDAGAGDYADLRTLCEIVRDAGGSTVAVNPLHLLPYGGDSPYSPSSRTYLNWIYLDVATLPGSEPDDLTVEVRTSQDDAFVDYARLYEWKFTAARNAFDRFSKTANNADAEEFDRFLELSGPALRRAATFEALAAHFRRLGKNTDWRTWPEELRDPSSSAVEAFAREARDDVAFYSYLQWQANVQLARVEEACRTMPIGLYRDLAVGTQLGGVDTWLGNGALRGDVAVGAPADLYNRQGQDWGVAPFDPLALREAGYEPFAALIRANARYAGALRIDHVMGLSRLWWVPAGKPATQGAYVSYRIDEMLAVLALESARAKCLIVGEDLGTVPVGFRERMEAANVFSYRLLQFEVNDDGFLPPSGYPELALVSTGTHDLPTMAAYETGMDIALRSRVTGLDDVRAREEREDRERKRKSLEVAFAAANVSRHGTRHIGIAANEFLSQAPSRLLMVTMEDVLGETDQLNVPTTTEQYPNWRHRTSVPLERLATDENFTTLAAALRKTRGAEPRA